MGQSLIALKTENADYTVEDLDEGFVLIARPGRSDRFSAVVRNSMAAAGNDFVILPTPDSNGGYERAVVLPLD